MWVVQAAIQEAAWVEQAQMWVVELAAQVEAVAVAQAAAVALVEQAVTLAVQVARDPLLEERAEQHPLQKILVAEVEEPRLILHLAVVVEEYSCLFHP